MTRTELRTAINAAAGHSKGSASRVTVGGCRTTGATMITVQLYCDMAIVEPIIERPLHWYAAGNDRQGCTRAWRAEVD